MSSSKDLRRAEAAQHPTFLQKRFRFSSAERARAFLQAVRAAYAEVQTVFPGLASVTLFGSRLKGYDAENSDIDLYAILNPKLALPSGSAQSLEGLLSTAFSFTLEKRGFTADTHTLIMSPTDVAQLVLHGNGFDNQRLTPFLFPSIDRKGILPYRVALFNALDALEQRSPGTGEDRWLDIRDQLCFDENQVFAPEHMNKRLALYPATLEQARRVYLG